MEQTFQTAADNVKKLKTKPDDSELLQLYGLYKQSTVGDNGNCTPSFLDLKGKAKHHAWCERKGMTKETAMAEYVALANSLIQKYGLNGA